MDRELRRLQRPTQHSGDLQALVQLAHARRRHQPTRRPRIGNLVYGPVLAELLKAALASREAREVDLLREHGVAENRLEPWINNLRALMRGETRSWVWVVRWTDLLGVRLDDLAWAAEIQKHPERTT